MLNRRNVETLCEHFMYLRRRGGDAFDNTKTLHDDGKPSSLIAHACAVRYFFSQKSINKPPEDIVFRHDIDCIIQDKRLSARLAQEWLGLDNCTAFALLTSYIPTTAGFTRVDPDLDKMISVLKTLVATEVVDWDCKNVV